MTNTPRTFVRWWTLAMILTTACARGDDGALDSAAGQLDSAVGALTDIGRTMSDREILGALTTANAAEIALSRMALDNASNAQVKEFAQMMVSDHQAMSEQVHGLGEQLNLTTTVGEQGDDLAPADAADELRGKRGAEFDRAYMDVMVSSHEETLATIDRAAQSTSTPQIDQALADARSRVQQHLTRAREIQRTLRSGDTSAASL